MQAKEEEIDFEMNEPCNAKLEFESALIKSKKTLEDIKCATISIEACNKRCMEQFKQYEDPDPVNIKLTLSHTQEQAQEFLDKLDVVYDCGYGGQELFGTVWFTDGTWFTRYEYDGSECWQLILCPEIPEDLM